MAHRLAVAETPKEEISSWEAGRPQRIRTGLGFVTICLFVGGCSYLASNALRSTIRDGEAAERRHMIGNTLVIDSYVNGTVVRTTDDISLNTLSIYCEGTEGKIAKINPNNGSFEAAPQPANEFDRACADGRIVVGELDYEPK